MTQVAPVGIRCGDLQALPVGEPLTELTVRSGQVLDPLARLGGRLFGDGGELVALGLGGGLGFGGP